MENHRKNKLKASVEKQHAPSAFGLYLGFWAFVWLFLMISSEQSPIKARKSADRVRSMPRLRAEGECTWRRNCPKDCLLSMTKYEYQVRCSFCRRQNFRSFVSQARASCVWKKRGGNITMENRRCMKPRIEHRRCIRTVHTDELPTGPIPMRRGRF